MRDRPTFPPTPSQGPPSTQAQIAQKCHARSGEHRPFTLEERSGTVPDRLNSIFRTFPDRLAATDGHRRLTYRDLNQRSEWVQTELHRHSAFAENVLLFTRDPLMAVVMIAACAKSGRPFIALDPAYPKERLEQIAKDSQAKWVLTDPDSDSDCQRLQLPAASIRIPNLSAATPKPPPTTQSESDPLTPETSAFLVYTSGSTGAPKGVIHTHRSLLHNIANYTDLLRVTAEDRITRLHALSFSSGLVELFLALLNGASSHAWNVAHNGFSGLADWFDSNQITLVNWIPTPFRQFAETIPNTRALRSVRALLLGSEPVLGSDAQLALRLFGEDCLFVNRLGATETGNYRVYWIDSRCAHLEGPVPAGYAVPGTEALLLAEDFRTPAPPNSPGMIAIRSRANASGYWNRPEATSASFIPDPAGGAIPLYVTGDLGRMDPDGCLHFLGRKDHQVKIRGVRIELGEIETALRQFPGIHQAAAAPRLLPNGQSQLIAFFIPAPSDPSKPPPESHKLQAFLAARLPAAFVPDLFLPLERFPTTPSGKLDRNALLKHVPDASFQPTPSSDTGSGTILSPTEQRLHRLWQRLLARPHISPTDRFFDIGGNSLLAASLCAQIENEFGVRLPLATLISAPTLSELAVKVQTGPSPSDSANLIPIQPSGTRFPLVFVHAHMGNVVGYLELARHLPPDQPFYALQANGLDGVTEPFESLPAMATHYANLLRSKFGSQPIALGGFCFGGSMAMELAHQLSHSGVEIPLVITIQGRSHAYPKPNPRFSPLQRKWLRVRARLESERIAVLENLQHPLRHFGSRLGRVGQILSVAMESRARALARFVGCTLRPSHAAHMRKLEFAHIRAFRSHTFRPYSGRVLVVRAAQGSPGALPDPTLGWKDLVQGDLITVEISGPQFGMLCAPRVEKVAALLTRELERSAAA